MIDILLKILILIPMSERLQVILESDEYSAVRKNASRDGKTISDWVRSLIRERLARRSQTSEMDAIQIFKTLQLPAPPIDQMLKEIEEGRS